MTERRGTTLRYTCQYCGTVTLRHEGEGWPGALVHLEWNGDEGTMLPDFILVRVSYSQYGPTIARSHERGRGTTRELRPLDQPLPLHYRLVTGFGMLFGLERYKRS